MSEEMTNFIVLGGGLTIQYLVPCEGGYLMVEAGDEVEFPRFLNKLKKAGVGIDEIRYLLLTHHHGDHAGFTAALRERSGCRVIAHREARLPLEKGKNATIPEGGFSNRLIIVFTWAASKLTKSLKPRFTPVKMNQDDYLIEGDDDTLLRSLGVAGKILHTPGHSPDSIALLLDNGACFCGDAAMSFLHRLGLRYCCIYMTDVEEYYRSWRKMIAAGAQIFYPAHGRPFPPQKLQKNLDHLRQEDLVVIKAGKNRPIFGKAPVNRQ